MAQLKLTTFQGLTQAGFQFEVNSGRGFLYKGASYKPGDKISDPDNPQRMELLFKQRRIVPIGFDSAAKPVAPAAKATKAAATTSQPATAATPKNAQTKAPAAEPPAKPATPATSSQGSDSQPAKRGFGRRARS